MEPRWLPPPILPNCAASAWDSSDAMRLKYVLPRDAGRERTPMDELGLSGEETKPLPRADCVRDCREENDWSLASGERRGESKVEVSGVRG